MKLKMKELENENKTLKRKLTIYMNRRNSNNDNH